MPSTFQAGVGRRKINPPPGVELAGLGYYLGRIWERVHDDLAATALVISEGQETVAVVAVDLMYNDVAFTQCVREKVFAAAGIKPESVCVNFSHSHNAPTAGLILGAGERDPKYLENAASLTADAVIEAWRQRQAVTLKVGRDKLEGMTFNRTREGGPVDTTVSVLQAVLPGGQPLAIAVNFHSHCTAHMEVDLRAITRDWPGEVVDSLEVAFPGATAMYLQGSCGDVNFRREFNGTERRFEPAKALTRAALDALQNSRRIAVTGISSRVEKISLPTRRWTEEEIRRERDEGLYRLKTGDTAGWLEGVARVCVNLPERLPLRYGGSVEKAVAAVSRFAVEWTGLILPELRSRPENLLTEIQTLRIGDVWFAANPSELFTTLALDVRRQWPEPDLFMLGFSNGSIGYLPDAYDIERGSYAALQSPKFTGQFPFTPEAGPAMVNGLLQGLERVKFGAKATSTG